MTKAKTKMINNSLAKQGKRIIQEDFKNGYGRSKKEMRKDNKSASPAIHNSLTAESYTKHWCYYCKFLSENGITTKSLSTASKLENIRKYGEYLENSGYSASTIHTYLAAVCRVTENSLKELHDSESGWTMPERTSAAFTRSRYSTESDRHYSDTSEKNRLAITLARCAGLRNYKELQELHGSDIIERDGKLFVNVNRGKGGKRRTSDIIGSKEEIDLILSACRAAGDGKVCNHVNSHIDIHSFRAEYAARIYTSIAMTEEHLQGIARKNERDKRIYITKIARPGIPSGTVFDRKALSYASLQLGHNLKGRESMIVSCYGYKILEILTKFQIN